ncbi:MAG: NADH-quinone oxidoreductase subunit N [Candidatus Promineifilaceae bacterium]
MSAPSLEAILAITPEICLVILAVVVLLYDRDLKPAERRNPALISAWGTLAVILITVGIWLFLDQPDTQPVQYWGGMISQDLYTLVFRLVFLVALLVTCLISIDVVKLQRGEYFALLITATIGFSLMAASTDLIMLYVALETAGISLYALSGFTKGVYRSTEAGMKYFIYGAFATAVMLYGLSLLYGLTTETNIYEVARVIFQGLKELDAAVLLASSLIVVGFGFKISAVPFHFWAPDVYEGAPSPVTGLISTASKAAGFAVLLRVTTAGIFGPPESANDWWAMLVAMCIVTMTLGNLLAIRQTNIKRMLAYSSIAQAGYGMIGVVTALTTLGLNAESVDGASATMFFLIYYVLTNIAAFGVIIVFSNLTGSDEISDLSGLSRRSPWLALAMMFALLSLSGIPPTAGFFGKFFIFRAAVEAGLWWLALIGILNALIALYYYLSVIKVMYLYRSEDESISIPVSRAAALALGITVFGILYLGVFADRTFEWTREAALALFPFFG